MYIQDADRRSSRGASRGQARATQAQLSHQNDDQN